ncbi:arginine--tRNA ligase [Bacillus sp. JJ1609]|uniref:arginine--tRNA ligase n=1 Tax=Bacillus sp. JJ1609 TaxID=3122977 RepID=UPI002FFDA752
MKYVKNFAQIIDSVLVEKLTIEDVEQLIEKPRFSKQGDLAFPCFQLAKVMRKAPAKIAQELSNKLQGKSLELFEKVEPAGGYVNAFLNKRLIAKEVVKEIMEHKERYGDLSIGENGTVAIDLSSPNIAKPFSMGHLRSTVIGNAIALILEKTGYKPVKINHLGDWGTQFGKLITAYKMWGSEEKVKTDPIKELLALYIRFHEEAEANLELEQAGRDWFKRLEDGDEHSLELWKWFRDESLKEFTKIYDLMGIEFDSFAGEAFYNDNMAEIVELLEDSGLLKESDGAQVVTLDENELPPCLIKKSDGATLYATRDLAAAKYRFDQYRFVKSLYVVGNEQSLHFKQLKAVLAKMNFNWADDLVHIPFGMMLKDGKKMSTRKGKVVLLEEVMNESIQLGLKNIEEKNPSLANKEETAAMVGTGAIMFHDLKNFRMNDIEFSLGDMLKVEGETGPYVQYTNARAQSILRKAAWSGNLVDVYLYGEAEWPVVIELLQFPEAIRRAAGKYDPSQIAKYVLDLAQAFNKYYGEIRILDENEEKESRLALVYSVSVVLEEGLRLLGIKAPKEM